MVGGVLLLVLLPTMACSASYVGPVAAGMGPYAMLCS